jgi:hypothetical protein
MFSFLNGFTKNINESKIFAGLIIIILNVGGKLIPITLSKSAENILKSKISRDIIIFAISWMGTRDIVISFILTISFILISDFLLNYDSSYCCVPKKYQNIVIDDDVTDEELNRAILILEKSKKNKEIQHQHNTYSRFYNIT